MARTVLAVLVIREGVDMCGSYSWEFKKQNANHK
jgi:hypothetical protein